MGPLGFPELILIFIVALIVFGPRRLPEIGRTLGKALGEFKKATEELKNTIEREVHVEEMRKITPVVVAPVQTVSRTEPGIMLPASESTEQYPQHDSSGQLIQPEQAVGMQHQLPADFFESTPHTPAAAIEVEAVRSLPTGAIETVHSLPASSVTANKTSSPAEPIANEPHAG